MNCVTVPLTEGKELIICFRCDHTFKTLLDKLVASGEYVDYSQAISVAVTNLAVLREELGPNSTIVVSEGEHRRPDVRSTPRDRARAGEVDRQVHGGRRHVSRSEGAAAAARVEVPALFRL